VPIPEKEANCVNVVKNAVGEERKYTSESLLDLLVIIIKIPNSDLMRELLSKVQRAPVYFLLSIGWTSVTHAQSEECPLGYSPSNLLSRHPSNSTATPQPQKR
jgi:hypothetical protein